MAIFPVKNPKDAYLYESSDQAIKSRQKANLETPGLLQITSRRHN